MLTLYMCAIETLPLYATACVLSLIGWRSVPTFSFGWMRALPSCYPPLMQVTGAQRPGRTRTHTHTHTRLHTRRPDGPRPRWLSRWATTQSVQPPHSHLPLLLGLFLFLSPIFLSSSTLYLLVTGESRRCQTLCNVNGCSGVSWYRNPPMSYLSSTLLDSNRSGKKSTWFCASTLLEHVDALVTWLSEIRETLRLSHVTTGVEMQSLGQRKGCRIGNWRAGHYMDLRQPSALGGWVPL